MLDCYFFPSESLCTCNGETGENGEVRYIYSENPSSSSFVFLIES